MTSMDMRDEWLRGLREWASKNDNVRELWLFGSRADGTSGPESDVDIGIGLMPPTTHNYALGNFYAFCEKWERELEAIAGRSVDLQNITPDKPGIAKVREWRLLWSRDAPTINDATKQKLLAFVDEIVPGPPAEVWLTGSRVRGNARPDSDWDVVAFTDLAPREPEKLFLVNQLSKFTIEGGIIELVIAHPDHWNDPRQYMSELRRCGLRLRG